jgi:N-acetylmuramate 1-kinase
MDPAIQHFITVQGWPENNAQPFPADWSQRRFFRLRRQAEPLSAVLMQTAPDHDFFAFIEVARFLRARGFHAPEIYAVEPTQGLLLLEDLGEKNMGRYLDAGAEPLPLLRAAIELLVAVQRECLTKNNIRQVPETWPDFNISRWQDLLQPLCDAELVRDPVVAQTELDAIWQNLLQPLEQLPRSLLLRDYIADNLMLLPSSNAQPVIGLLDFELAGEGCILYDIASLTEQVRRDLTPELRHELLDYYFRFWPQLDRELFDYGVAFFSLHRHLRHWARLQKRQKPEMLQRVEKFVLELLQQPAAHPMRDWWQRNRNFMKS